MMNRVSYPDVHGFVEPDDYELYHDLHGPDDCGVYCVSQGDAGVMPYWTGGEECDAYEGDVALPRTGSDEPFSNSIYISPPGSGGPGDEDSDIYESAVTLHRTGLDHTVNNVVSTVSLGGPCDEDSPPRTESDEPFNSVVRTSPPGPCSPGDEIGTGIVLRTVSM